MTEMKLTDKEEKVVASIISFFQGYKDCPKEDKEKFILDNAFMARNIIAFKNLEPKNAYVLLSSTIIHNIIPFIFFYYNNFYCLKTNLFYIFFVLEEFVEIEWKSFYNYSFKLY